jgi:RHS repeat-associated protein
VRTWLAANDDRYSLYDEGGQWLGEYDASGASVRQIVWLGSLPVGVLTGSGSAQKLHYIEADALGTPRVVVDPTRGAGGTAVWRWELTGEAFGNTAPDQDPDSDSVAFVFDMRFPGQRYDNTSGLNYNYFRDYEPGLGRYSQSDPIGLAGGISTYGYVSGSPFTRIDPYGLQSHVICANPANAAACAAAGIEISGAAGAGTAGAGTAGTGTAVGGVGVGWWSRFASDAAGVARSVGAVIDAICDDENEEECEALYRVDTDTCNAITRRRGARAGAACHESASQRYAACLRGDPIPPLNTWNN